MTGDSRLDTLTTAADRIREHLDEHDQRLGALYTCGTPTAASGNVLTLTFRFPMHAKLVGQQAAGVLEAIHEVTGISFASLVTEVG